MLRRFFADSLAAWKLVPSTKQTKRNNRSRGVSLKGGIKRKGEGNRRGRLGEGGGRTNGESVLVS